MRVVELLRVVPTVLAKRGPTFIAKYFTELFWFDLRHGTHTTLRVEKRSSNVSALAALEDGVHYVGSFTSVVRQSVDVATDVVKRRRSTPPQFVDLGCGKGKALL